MALRWLYLSDIDSIQHMHSDQESRIALFWPDKRDAIRWILGTTVMCACFIGLIMGLNLDRTPAWTDDDHWLMITLVFASGGMMILVTFVLAMQRLEIHGATIRSANMKTLYRWRSVDAREVIAMEVSLGGYESTIAVLRLILAPAPHRQWNKLEVFAVFGGSDTGAIDNRFFVPIAESISAVNPSIRIAYLPRSYKGALNHLRATAR